MCTCCVGYPENYDECFVTSLNVHLLSGCYVAAESKLNVEKYLVKFGLLKGECGQPRKTTCQFNIPDHPNQMTLRIYQKCSIHRVRQVMLSADDDLRMDKDPEERPWLAKVLTSSGSSFAIAFVCTKALLPVRLPLTVAVTPAVAR